MSLGALACAVRSHLINIVTRQISIVGDKMEALAARARMEGRAPSRPHGKQDATEGVPPFQHNHFYKHNGKCCSRGYNATNGLAEQTVLSDSIAVNEIGKRKLHPLEHAPRFFLGPMEGMLDSCLGAANDSAFVVAILSYCYHFLHGRTGKHSFRAPDRAATRTDIDRAERARRFICERDNPDGLAPFIRAERVTCGRKTRVRFFRSMTRDRVRAVGIEI